MEDIISFLIKFLFMPTSQFHTLLVEHNIFVSAQCCCILLWIIRVTLFLTCFSLITHKFIFKPLSARNEYIRKQTGADYKEYLSTKSKRLFIDTYFQGKPPYIYADLQDSLSDSRENMIKAYLERILVKNCTNRLFCVLGGSGMGKTSFLVNLLRKYVNKYWINKRPYDIQLVNLARENCLESITRIDNQSTTVLLLDALDENLEAINNYDVFIGNLEKSIEAFPIVIVSCRTQFFPDEEHELKESKIRSYGRDKGFEGYTRHYISPFSDKDVDKYLRKKYRLRYLRKRKARKIIDKCSSLIHRPLLLSYIDDLLDNKNNTYNNILDIYEELIDKWISREVSAREDRNALRVKLQNFSEQLAINMYNNKNLRGGYCVPRNEVDSILNLINVDASNYEFKGRSLINRDARGDMKFSHKSFLEYYLAKYKFDNFVDIRFDGMEVAATLYKQMCQQHIDKYILAEELQLSKSYMMLESYDTLVIKKHTGFDIRYLSTFENIKILVINQALVPEIIEKLAETHIYYVKVEGYKRVRGESINQLLSIDTVQFISINGDICSNTFIKAVKKGGKSLINNGELINYTTDRNISAPYDFLSINRMQIMRMMPYNSILKF